jgi:peptide/nickel transport system ATP-binding protein
VTAAAAAPLLLIRDLVVEAEASPGEWRRIVDGVSLELARGEVLGLIGESGAGKSTIGLAALGYVRPHGRFGGGEVVLDGQDLLRLPPGRLREVRGRRVAYVAQSAAAAFNPAKTIDAQVVEVVLRHGLAGPAEARRIAAGLYRELALPEPERFGAKYPHQASGGQLQRAMVAMALAGRPDLIVFDEPTTALDVTTQIEVLAAIGKAIRGHGTAALYISHDLAVVAQVADRVLVLRHGRAVEEGDTTRILNAPREPYTQALVSARRDHPKPVEPPEPPLLEVRGVAAAYGGGSLRVLEGIDLEVPRGRTVAVVGESGSGKSTLARVVTGLLPPLEGRIAFRGEPLPPRLAARDRARLRKIQLVHQLPDVALNPRQRVAEALGRPLELFRGLRGRRQRERVDELLTQVGLPPEFARRYPGQLSGGQKQRVCVARALAAEPDLILCDEVTSALDPLVAEELLELLLRLQRETGVAYLVITHDLGVVKRTADHVVVMQRGRIVEQGPLAEVLTPPHHPYTERLLASVPEMRKGWLDEVLQARGVPAAA